MCIRDRCEYASDVGVDNFGHKMLTGSGKYLENLVKERLGIKVRSVELNVSQRCSSACLSAADLDEAVCAGTDVYKRQLPQVCNIRNKSLQQTCAGV